MGEQGLPIGKSAQELGIVYPGSYCDELKTVPHYWIGVDRIYGGTLFQCKLCKEHLWLPADPESSRHLGNALRYDGNEGYCCYLDKHWKVKALMVKLQDLRRLEKMEKKYSEDQYEQDKAWEEEQAHLASENAKAIADAEVDEAENIEEEQNG